MVKMVNCTLCVFYEKKILSVRKTMQYSQKKATTMLIPINFCNFYINKVYAKVLGVHHKRN